jgi:hypothetical protein
MLSRVVTATVTLLLAVSLGLSLGLSSPAQASHGGDDDVRKSGHCSGAAHWKLKAKHDDGRIEVEAEIEGSHSGTKWHWTFKHNGSTSATGAKRTSGRSGSFEVERRMTDLSGKDHFVFRATHGGAVCRGTISA